MKLPVGGGGREWVQAKAGTAIARAFKFIDLGTQETRFIDEKTGLNKLVRQIRVEFELPNQTIEIEGIPKPLVIGKDYTASMHEKAVFRLHQESRIGKKLTDDEAKAFEATSVVGKPCLLSIAHSDKGNAYIASMAGIPEGMDVPDQFNEDVVFLLDEFNQGVFDELPDWIKDKIKASPEYKSAVNRAADPMPDLDEDIPF